MNVGILAVRPAIHSTITSLASGPLEDPSKPSRCRSFTGIGVDLPDGDTERRGALGISARIGESIDIPVI